MLLDLLDHFVRRFHMLPRQIFSILPVLSINAVARNAQYLATAAEQTAVVRSRFNHENAEYHTKSWESFRSQASVARPLRSVL